MAGASVPAGVVLLGSDLAPWQLVGWLTRHGSWSHGAIVGWLLLAPLLLALAWWGRRRSAWPWVGVVGVQLGALAVVVSRFPHLVPAWGWWWVAATLLAGLASLVTAFGAAATQRGP